MRYHKAREPNVETNSHHFGPNRWFGCSWNRVEKKGKETGERGAELRECAREKQRCSLKQHRGGDGRRHRDISFISPRVWVIIWGNVCEGNVFLHCMVRKCRCLPPIAPVLEARYSQWLVALERPCCQIDLFPNIWGVFSSHGTRDSIYLIWMYSGWWVEWITLIWDWFYILYILLG